MGQGNNGMKEQRVVGKSTQRNDKRFEQFKAEVCQDWDTALQSNLQAFEGKFKLYHDQLEANLHRYMHEESDRVISEVTKGPHNLIRDPARLFPIISILTHTHHSHITHVTGT